MESMVGYNALLKMNLQLKIFSHREPQARAPWPVTSLSNCRARPPDRGHSSVCKRELCPKHSTATDHLGSCRRRLCPGSLHGNSRDRSQQGATSPCTPRSGPEQKREQVSGARERLEGHGGKCRWGPSLAESVSAFSS